MTQPLTVLTIGHSTRSFDELVSLLAAEGVRLLADVRTVPRSRRHPHFSRDALEAALPARGIAYRHLPGLGGLRHPRQDSPNTAWQNASFRGYADHMATPAFEAAVIELLGLVEAARTCVMCAEAVWWRCHRQLIADALTVRGVEVRHIVPPRAPAPHRLTAFARVDGHRVTYPGVLEPPAPGPEAR